MSHLNILDVRRSSKREGSNVIRNVFHSKVKNILIQICIYDTYSRSMACQTAVNPKRLPPFSGWKEVKPLYSVCRRKSQVLMWLNLTSFLDYLTSGNLRNRKQHDLCFLLWLLSFHTIPHYCHSTSLRCILEGNWANNHNTWLLLLQWNCFVTTFPWMKFHFY